jgi:hypothetical protein
LLSRWRAPGTNACLAQFKGMNALSNWPCNRLLLALSSGNLKRLMPELEQVRCQPEQVLMDADSALDHVFPRQRGRLDKPPRRRVAGLAALHTMPA